MIKAHQRILLQTNVARDKAEALLEGLLRARTEAQRCPAETNEPPTARVPIASVAMDRAIDATGTLIDRLNRVMVMAEDELNEQVIDLLDEAVAELDRCDRLDCDD